MLKLIGSIIRTLVEGVAILSFVSVVLALAAFL